MQFGRGAVLSLLLALSAAGAAQAGGQNFYYDPLGRLLGETQDDAGGIRASRSDPADNISYLHVLAFYGPGSVSTLSENQGMVVNQSLTSTDGRFGFSVQANGTLAVYQISNGTTTPLWSTNTSGQSGFLLMQADGNLVFYSPDDRVIWWSNTSGNPGADLVMQSDGNLVLYNGSNVIWSSGTGGH